MKDFFKKKMTVKTIEVSDQTGALDNIGIKENFIDKRNVIAGDRKRRNTQTLNSPELQSKRHLSLMY